MLAAPTRPPALRSGAAPVRPGGAFFGGPPRPGLPTFPGGGLNTDLLPRLKLLENTYKGTHDQTLPTSPADPKEPDQTHKNEVDALRLELSDRSNEAKEKGEDVSMKACGAPLLLPPERARQDPSATRRRSVGSAPSSSSASRSFCTSFRRVVPESRAEMCPR